MPINSRRKGAVAEKEVRDLIQPWWRQLPIEQQETPDGKPAQFMRTPLSGGWSTRQARGNFRVSGDLSSTSQSFPFTIEVKRRENWSLKVFVYSGVHCSKGSAVWGWWKQCVDASKEEGGVPMLWMRKSNNPWIILLPESVAVERLGVVSADIYFAGDPAKFIKNKSGVHPVGYLAEKVLASNPAEWLGLRRSIAPPAGECRQVLDTS